GAGVRERVMREIRADESCAASDDHRLHSTNFSLNVIRRAAINYTQAGEIVQRSLISIRPAPKPQKPDGLTVR
ncbi:MAG: hypothetical protein ACREBD_08165, partial [Blastocatellia bacterium]